MAKADTSVANGQDRDSEYDTSAPSDHNPVKPNEDLEEESEILKSRDQELATKAKVRVQLTELFARVDQGYQDQWERADNTTDYWDCYNCKLGPKQFYVGTSKVYVPAIHDAVNARKTRFANQIFPQSGRHVDVTTHTGDIPYDIVALMEHYVGLSHLRTKMPALLRNGDIEGQYNIYVDWCEQKRQLVYRTKQNPEVDGHTDPTQEVETMVETDVEIGWPDVEILHDSDILILPQTVNSIEEAFEAGGSVTILRRWSKGKVEQMMDDKMIRHDMGEALLERMNSKNEGRINQSKELIDAAGIKGEGEGKWAQVYETWSKLKIGSRRLICRSYYGGENLYLSCKRNPNWSDKCNLISTSVEAVAGAFKGQSKVKFSADAQYAINDVINEGLDSAQYSLLPIVMTDPSNNPRIGSMVLNMAAIWQVDPKSTTFANMPPLWKDAFEIIAQFEGRIQKNLSVSPAAITQQGATAKTQKKNQAEMQVEMQIDLLSTADAVTVVEQGILSPLLQRFVELDHQYRDKTISVRQYGEMGYRANMQDIDPIQWDARFTFKWLGVEAARQAQAMQQQIAMLNVLRGIPPQMYPGRKLNIEPVMTQMIENAFGPRLAALIWGNVTDQLSVDPKTENDMLSHGLPVETHLMDDDAAHLKVHMQIMQQVGADASGQFRLHIQNHINQMKQKQQMQMMAAMQGGQGGGAPGSPGGPKGQPGTAGTPRIGSQPGAPRSQGPPGMIHQDRLRSAGAGPRKV